MIDEIIYQEKNISPAEYKTTAKILSERIELLAKDVLSSKHEGRELLRAGRIFWEYLDHEYDSEALVYIGDGRVCSFAEYKKPRSDRIYKRSFYCGPISELYDILSIKDLDEIKENIVRIIAEN